jgi:flagellar motility protein MotE (MotC chaperone)
MKALQNPIVSSLTGGVLYLAVTAWLMLRGGPLPAPHDELPPLPSSAVTATTHNPKVIWDPRDGETDQLIKELQREKAAIASRELQLHEWEERLKSEQAELTVVTQRVFQIRNELDRDITRVREDEVANLKRLSKMYGSMEPAAAANVFLEMDESSVVKIMMVMKDAETAPVLDALARQGAVGAKRAASLSERLRLTQAAPKKTSP